MNIDNFKRRAAVLTLAAVLVLAPGCGVLSEDGGNASNSPVQDVPGLPQLRW
ncbi:MAG: hypothetical protein R2849_22280 [Thermomicrobiales bacterium]